MKKTDVEVDAVNVTSNGDKRAAPSGKLGARLREWRTSRGLTLAVVSEKTGVASSSLSKIENEQVSVSYHTLKKICDGLNIPIEEIINP